MRLKSYYSNSVEMAMQQARHELGDEAMLLDTRSAPAHAQHLGSYEVVFALENAPDEETTAGKASASENPAPRPRSADHPEARRMTDDLGALRRELDRIKESVARSRSYSVAVGSMLSDPDFARCYAELSAADVASDVAQEILAACARESSWDTNGPQRLLQLQGAITHHIQNMLSVDSSFNAPLRSRPTVPLRDTLVPPTNVAGNQSICAFVGPPGAGKTTLLAKLAAQYGLESRCPMHIISLDGLRIASSEQLRTMAAILGATFQLVEKPSMLSTILADCRNRAWIWIDTPGAGPQECDIIEEIAETLRKHSGITVHLVLSAAMKSADLRMAVELYSPVQPDRIAFAHLDETENYGGLLSVASWLDKPISFLSTGQRIPEDLEAPTVERVSALITNAFDHRSPSTWLTAQRGAAAGH